ncbi:MAG: hypothetical protein ACJ798_06015 [Phenylobacterium sp.]
MSDEGLRQELLAARANVERQIEILMAGPASLGKGGAFIDNSSAVDALRETLSELDEGLANLGSTDA